ncbi:hypothetical protein BcepSauron_026 [Burkholderia phage BcepSauron]|uniref:Uncharacterized protein n=2 Tax=Sarumanvirus TaxID=2843450 RepID=A0A482MLN8_9CAUD|nr:hypothetical protein H1O16_gp025 [Burkholderia phage BcepSaruman]YP_009904404.1 hypothetical protein H1O17_gp026 [Burkholderia phage BcepSauron]QBQ74406.1 hypothetical protein BcepSauron_026 [Burkholderia phage BcepSauron]QBX06438.1 hypothetical protein BcepSaruman_025 [Burkholderia phage BcepSaruman]
MAKLHVVAKFKNGATMTLCYARGYQKRDTLNGLVSGPFFDAAQPGEQCEHCRRARAADKAKKAAQ